jgi:uncharacterized protein YjbJ (UPF0337 family)
MSESGKVTETKGRLEEAAGVLRNDKQQRSKGQNDQLFGKLKQAREQLNAVSNDLTDANKK